MAKILSFSRRVAGRMPSDAAAIADLTRNFSVEVMPRTAAKIDDFRAIFPEGTRIYLAHIDGTDFAEMRSTARRLVDEGFSVMPHFPARGIVDAAELAYRAEAYADLGIREALVLAGGIDTPRGAYADSMQLLEAGVFDRFGYTHLHVAGHPEGNRDIDPKGGSTNVSAALRWKNDFQTRTDARMAIVTQFCFDPDPVIAWADGLRAEGITLPIHLGIAGPAKLQTMIKFAMACGVGPSLRVLQRRARDLTKLVMPFEPTEMLGALARHKAANPDFPVERVHFFPLGGIGATAEYLGRTSPAALRSAHA